MLLDDFVVVERVAVKYVSNNVFLLRTIGHRIKFSIDAKNQSAVLHFVKCCF